MPPHLYIITGSNGAGKSTVGPAYLPQEVQKNHTVFDGDLLYTRKLNELFPSQTKSPKEARNISYKYVSELFESLVEEAIVSKSDFVYEGHFTNNATWSIPQRFKNDGYEIHLIFLGLKNINLSQLRVTDRVTEGGHYVNRNTIESNFTGNLEKLDHYFTLLDELVIIDSSEIDHKLLLSIQNQKVIYQISKDELPQWFSHYLVNIIQFVY